LTRTLKPDFCETFEFVTTLPGPSVLKIQVKDWNRFYPVHELVGETKIDVEDRWFHPKWQDQARKPVEVRNLYHEESGVVQGQLQLWLEILPAVEMRRKKVPLTLLERPPVREFEVRIICWKSKAVPLRMGDFYVKFKLANEKPRSTDVHWRCQTGRASWNWRVKFALKLPLESPEQCRLAIELWDQDVLKWNECLGSATVDLYRWFLKAYRENRTVDVFKEINDALKKIRSDQHGLVDEDDLEDEEEDEEDEEDEDEEEDAGLLLEEDDDEASQGEDAKEEPRKKRKKKVPPNDEDDDDDDKEVLPDEKEGGKSDAQYLVKQLKELVGLGDLDDTAQWIKMVHHDHKRGRIADRGSVAISIEILPKDVALVRPAGHGISSPNTNPTLPPRTGRLSLSLNPFYLLSALCGPEVAVTIFLCGCLALFLFVWFYVGVYYESIYNEYQMFSHLLRRRR